MHSLPEKITASALAQSLQAGEFTSTELVQHYLDKIQENCANPVFITLTAEQALAEANASDKRRASGQTLSKWDGIPIAWKDLFDIQGTSTSAGSSIYANAPHPAKNADVFEACKQFGLISLGKTNLSEFAYSGLGLNPHYGTPINPFSKDTRYAPGGSSAGSAVAVASGMAPVAIGTDTAGSVRVPAAFCGIAGYKSSQSRYSKVGVFPLSESLDSLGSFAHSIEDLIMIDAMMRGTMPLNLLQPTSDKPEILIPETIVFDSLAPDILHQFEQMVSAIEAAGYRISKKPFPIFQEIMQLFGRHGTLTVAEAATFNQDLLNSDNASQMDQRVRERMLTAKEFTAQDYIKLQWERNRLQNEVASQLGHRFMLFPTVAFTAPETATLEADDELFARINLKALRNTMLGNYLGMPGVSIPIGYDRNGLPIGALLSGAHGHDDRVLAAANSLALYINDIASD